MGNSQVLEKEAFQKQMLEKLIWICAFMLVGARHPGATVGVVEKEYRSEVISHHIPLFGLVFVFLDAELNCFFSLLFSFS